MTNPRSKRVTIRFTEEEWELVTTAAEISHMSINTYIIHRTIMATNPLVLSPEQQAEIFHTNREENHNPLTLNSDDQRKMRRQLNLIAHFFVEHYKKQGMTPKEFQAILEGD